MKKILLSILLIGNFYLSKAVDLVVNIGGNNSCGVTLVLYAYDMTTGTLEGVSNPVFINAAYTDWRTSWANYPSGFWATAPSGSNWIFEKVDVYNGCATNGTYTPHFMHCGTGILDGVMLDARSTGQDASCYEFSDNCGLCSAGTTVQVNIIPNYTNQSTHMSVTIH